MGNKGIEFLKEVLAEEIERARRARRIFLAALLGTALAAVLVFILLPKGPGERAGGRTLDELATNLYEVEEIKVSEGVTIKGEYRGILDVRVKHGEETYLFRITESEPKAFKSLVSYFMTAKERNGRVGINKGVTFNVRLDEEGNPVYCFRGDDMVFYFSGQPPGNSPGSVPPTVARRPAPPEVSVPPVAVISADRTSGDAPLTVRFDGSNSHDQNGDIESYDWNFGDGSTGSGAVVTHTFRDFRNYTVKLRVTDRTGKWDEEFITIRVYNSPPRISDLVVKTDRLVAERRGQAVEAFFKYYDPNGNISRRMIVSYSGGPSYVPVTASFSPESDRSGRVEIKFDVNPPAEGYLRFTVVVEDERGARSNMLSGVVPVKSSNHPPSIWGVSLEPSIIPWCKTAVMWLSAHYKDEDDDVGPEDGGYFQLTFSSPEGNSWMDYIDVEVRQDGVVKSAFEFEDCIGGNWGQWKVEIKLVDSKGNKSNGVMKYFYMKDEY